MSAPAASGRTRLYRSNAIEIDPASGHHRFFAGTEGDRNAGPILL